MAWEASGLRCVTWFGVGRRWPARMNWMYLAFSLVETVACTASWVLRCSQKVFSLWRMADKTELCRQVYRPWWSATGQPLRTWRNVAGLPHMMHAGSTSDTPHRRRDYKKVNIFPIPETLRLSSGVGLIRSRTSERKTSFSMLQEVQDFLTNSGDIFRLKLEGPRLIGTSWPACPKGTFLAFQCG